MALVIADLFRRGEPFRTALIDPPWWEAGGGGRGAQNHYELLKTRQMPAVIVGSGLWEFAEHAHLYMWCTNNFLANGEAQWLMARLGFRAVTVLTWGKDRAGIGQYFRGRTEHILFGVRGRGMHPSVYTRRRDLDTLLTAPRGEHSAKPLEAKQRVMQRSRGPYLEMFSREAPHTAEWTVWGKEAKDAPPCIQRGAA